MQRIIVFMLVATATCYVVWSLSGQRSRLAILRAIETLLPALRGPCAVLRRRLESSTGCSSCSSNRRVKGDLQ